MIGFTFLGRGSSLFIALSLKYAFPFKKEEEEEKRKRKKKKEKKEKKKKKKKRNILRKNDTDPLGGQLILTKKRIWQIYRRGLLLEE